jgi:hypothetical protein
MRSDVNGLVGMLGVLVAYVRWAYPGPRAIDLPRTADGALRLHCRVLSEMPHTGASPRWGRPVGGALEITTAEASFTPSHGGDDGWHVPLSDVAVVRLNPEDGVAPPSVDVVVAGLGPRRLRVSDRPVRRLGADPTRSRREALAALQVFELLSRQDDG